MKSLWIVAGAVLSVVARSAPALALAQIDEIRTAAVPEPASLTLVVAGLVIAGVGAYRRRK